MRTLLTTLILGLFPLALQAQQIEKRAPAAPLARGTTFTADDGKPVNGIHLAHAQINAVVHGNLAQATMMLTFANETARVLGGNLVFPLPEGATVTGYGLDVNGQMVDGVAVEKNRARIIYETEIHKRVDPGLVEHVEGNAFRTRLFPIPAMGKRSVKIEYVTRIELMKDGAALSLPLGFGGDVDELSIRIDAPEATAEPSVKAGGIEGLTFAKAGRGFVAAASAKNARSGDELVIVLPEIAERSVAVEKRLKFPRTIEELEGRHHIDRLEKNGDGDFEQYFVATDSPVEPARKTAQMKSTRIGVVWDASLSRADADHGRELKLLESILNRFGHPETDLIILRNDVEVRPFFAGDAVGTAKLIETIRGLPYDGATGLGSLNMPKNLAGYRTVKLKESPADYDFFLLFTDGFGNLGADRPPQGEVPVFAICDDLRANHAMLRSICQESRGSAFNLKRATDEQVLAAVGDAPFSLVSVECNANEIAEVYPPLGTEVAGRFTVSGKLLVPEAKLTLHYGYGRQVVGSQTFTISSAGAEEGTLLPRFWAQQKVAALSLFPDKNAEELTKLGRQFNLVTPNTSLLVLETVEQYVQYRVVPPPTRPEFYKEFLAKIEQHRAQETQSQEQKMQQVAAMWNARVQWWEKEYKYPANLKVGPAKGESNPVLASTGPDASGERPINQLNVADERRTETAHAQGQPGQAGGGQRGNSAATSVDLRPATPPVNSPRARDQTVAASGGRDGAFANADSFLLPTNDPIIIGGWGFGRANESGPSVAVAIKSWDPKTPYIDAMKAVAPEKAYEVFLAQRKNYAKSPSFYFDCADYLLKVGQRALAIRVLTDVVELELHDARLLRIAAHRLNQIGEREMAIDLFEKVLTLRPEEPQSYRDLALALADRAEQVSASAPVEIGRERQEAVDRALPDYMRSLELLNKVVIGNWPRFPEIELPVLMEANNINAKVQRLHGVHDFHNPIDWHLQKNLDLDVRVVMTWDADQTDIDLWVTEPSGEKCLYSHNRTIIGGLLSHDFTDGYGPEEYCLRKLMPGQFAVQAQYYGSRQQELTGPATVQATIITNFGRANEKRQAISLRLKDAKDVVDVGTVTLGSAPAETKNK